MAKPIEPVDINALANITNSDWGNSSMPTGGKVVYSMKARIINKSLQITYTTIAKFASDNVLQAQMPQYDAEALQRLDKYMKLVKSKYKETTGHALSCKQRSTFANIELISMSHVSPVKTAYYRRTVIYDM